MRGSSPWRTASPICAWWLVVRPGPLAALGPRGDARRASLPGAAAQLHQRLGGAIACWSRPLAIASIPYGYVATGGGPWRIGDQAAVIPSFSGDGIAIAL